MSNKCKYISNIAGLVLSLKLSRYLRVKDEYMKIISVLSSESSGLGKTIVCIVSAAGSSTGLCCRKGLYWLHITDVYLQCIYFIGIQSRVQIELIECKWKQAEAGGVKALPWEHPWSYITQPHPFKFVVNLPHSRLRLIVFGSEKIRDPGFVHSFP